VKEYQEKDKIGSKPDKNGKRGEAGKSQKQLQSSSKLARDQTSNPTSSTNPTPKGRIHRSSKQKVENSHFEEHLTPVATMTDNRTMAEMLHAPTEGCAEAIIVPPILANKNSMNLFMRPGKDIKISFQTSAVTTAMTAMLKQLQSNPPPAQGELKAITTRSGLVTDGPTVPTPLKSKKRRMNV
nr:hypothetical protein [Tanacetum cinerariifolium]